MYAKTHSQGKKNVIGGVFGIRDRSGRRARRTLISMTRERAILLILTVPLLLFERAHSINKHLSSMERLLNLDGDPSTAFMTGSRTIENDWPVYNYLFKKR